MLFHEVHGAYFAAVGAILDSARNEGPTDAQMTAIIRAHAFSESALTILPALTKGEWPLLDARRLSILKHSVQWPVSLLQKRWLKALLLDPRIALFEPDARGLENIEPLFLPEDIVYLDRYGFGDPYGDSSYRQRFHLIRSSLQEKRMLHVCYEDGRGGSYEMDCRPVALEYASTSDRFRLRAVADGRPISANLGWISDAQLGGCFSNTVALPSEWETVAIEVELEDERNSLERFLLAFSHLRKRTECIDAHRYRVKVWCDREDESEMLYRLLAYGPTLRVVAPARIVQTIRELLLRQMALSHAFLHDG